MSDTPEQPTNGGWHQPTRTSYVNRQKWYKPSVALTSEQLDALQVTSNFERNLRASLATEDSIPPIPQRLGGWYTPENSFAIEPAKSLGDILPQLGEIPSHAVASLSDEEREALSVQIDSEELAFRQSPQVIGDVSTDIRDAPELPLSANLERGLGGLRDVERPDEPSAVGTEADDGVLTPEEIARMREENGATIDLPARGFGGVSDSVSPDGQVAAPQPTTIGGDTGEIQAVNNVAGGGSAEPNAVPASATVNISAGSFPQPSESGNNLSVNQQAANQSMSTSQPQQPQSAPQNQSAQRFREVEQSVQDLRQQFAQGQISRAQLEAELKRLLVLDEQGRWWTLGVDSKRWYRFDGREWVPDVPPQTASQPAVDNQNLNVPTETGFQPSVAGGTPAPVEPRQSMAKNVVDEHGMPLPQQVSIDDPGATAVNLQAVTAGLDEVTIEKPGPSNKSSQSASAADGISPEQALVGGSSVTQEGAIPRPDNAPAPADKEVSEDSESIRPPGVAKLDANGQPDYSAALGSRFSRSSSLRIALWAGAAGVLGVLAFVFIGLLASVGYYLNTVDEYRTEIDQLPQRASQFETVFVYAEQADGTDIELARFNDRNRGARTQVELEDISPWAIHALISTEDETFYTNPGFSMTAIIRAMYTNFTSTGPTSGASTITQQLARRLLLDEEFATDISANRKVTEIILANQISLQYDKNEILEIYFNEMSFGGFTVGIEAAAQVYFNKSASDLNVFESALLVGLIQSPGVYDPFINRDAALGRMETVLFLMVNNTGCIQMEHTTNVSGFDLSTPLCVTDDYLNIEVINERAFVEANPFTYFGSERLYDHFTLWVWDQVNNRYNQEDIFNNGFRIYTTVDPTIQNVAQDAVANQVNVYPGVNNGSVVVMDPQTGAVLAMVGSADFENQSIDGEVNVALTPQQPGSSIKPVVYLTAMEGFPEIGEYWSASTIIWDVPSEWPNGDGTFYQPVNYDGRYRGPVTLRSALANSLNIPAVKAMAFTGPGQFETVATRMNLEFPLQSPVDAGLSSSLGAAEVYLFDMVASYSAFANGGFYYEPFGINRIETSDGEVIFDVFANAPTPPVQTISPQHAYIISDMLSDQTARRSTFGTSLDIAGYPNVAVKTGTSNGPRDLWTIGWSSDVVVGVWMGNTDNSVIQPTTLSGSVVAGPVWRTTIQTALNGSAFVDFPPPTGIVESSQVCAESGALAPPEGCGPGGTIPREIYVGAGVLEDWPEGQPPLPSSEHTLVTIQVDRFTNQLVNEFCPNHAVERFFLNVDDPTAIAWLQNTSQGQQWAATRNIELGSVSTNTPTTSCDPSYVEPTAALTSPVNGQTISALVAFQGTATVPNFSRYEIQYAPVTAPNNFIVLDGQSYAFEQSGSNTVLGTWTSTSLPDGQYYLRLQVFSENGESIETQPVLVTLANVQSAPSIPSTDTTTFPTQTPTTGEAIPGGETTGQ